MQFKKLHPKFQLPTKGTEHAAGFDIYMPTPGYVTDSPVKVPLGFAAAVPVGYAALILPRSGAGIKGIELMNTCGVIDADYRGEWVAVLNTKGDGLHWNAGDRLLQFVLVPIPNVTPELVEELDSTERESGGFGSTGT